MRFLTNTHDPNDPRARTYLALSFDEAVEPMGREVAWQRHLAWLSDKIIADPQATEKYTVEELKAMGMVGVYAAN